MRGRWPAAPILNVAVVKILSLLYELFDLLAELFILNLLNLELSPHSDDISIFVLYESLQSGRVLRNALLLLV